MKPRLFVVMLLALALAACAGILGFKQTDGSHPFEHRAHVVKGVACVECHVGAERAGDTGPLHLPTDASCRGCHAKPHDERACLGCHGEASVRAGDVLARDHLRFDHAEHTKATHGDCVRCHSAIADQTPPETLLPTMATCFGCHEHQDQWSSRDCDGCHVDLAAENTAPSNHLIHEGDWLREHGVHAASERDLCSSCHTERSCAQCHGVGTTPTLPRKLAVDDVRITSLHAAGFRSRHADEARADPALCTTCHSVSSCEGCHTANHVSPAGTNRSPHPIGWLSAGRGGGAHGLEARIDPVSCASCHGGAGEQLCIGCHKVGGPGGSPHGPGFNSKKDQHHDLPCRQCHGTQR